MGKFETKKQESPKKEKVLVILCAVLAVTVVVLLVLLLRSNGNNAQVVVNSNDTAATNNATGGSVSSDGSLELVLYSVETVQDEVLVKTSFGDMAFPAAFGDAVKVTVVNEGTVKAVCFDADLGGIVYPAYTIYFSDDGDMPVGTLKLPQEQKERPVTIVFHETPTGLADDALLTFIAVQETFNNVWASLERNEGFTPSA